MVYQVEDIKRAVRVCLDENTASDALIVDGDEETLLFDDVIASKIAEGIDRVHTAAPYQLLEQGHNLYDDEAIAITWGEGQMSGTGFIYLPDDYLRLVVFEMSDWERAVYSVVDIASAEYAKQRSRVRGVRGTPQRPVCAIGVRPNGKVLEFYSSKDNTATVSRAVYIPRASVDASGGVDICERCYTAVVYMIAGLVCASAGEQERANTYYELSKTYLQV